MDVEFFIVLIYLPFPIPTHPLAATSFSLFNLHNNTSILKISIFLKAAFRAESGDLFPPNKLMAVQLFYI